MFLQSWNSKTSSMGWSEDYFLFLFVTPAVDKSAYSLLNLILKVGTCVTLDRRHAFVILTLAEVGSLVVDQMPISVLMAFMARCQFMSSVSRLALR